MRTGLAAISVFSLFVLMMVPAYAGTTVTSMSLEKSFYTTDEKFGFIGTLNGTETVFVIIRNAGGNFKGMLSDPLATDEFNVIPRPVSDYFSSSGIYNATAFTDEQKEEEGFTIKLEFDGNKVFEVPDIILVLKAIPDVVVDELKTVTFTASVTESSLEDVVYSLEANPPGDATIDSSSGKFVWTPSASHGNTPGAKYTFDVVATKGSQIDRDSITITVNEPTAVPPEPEPKETTSEPKETTSEPKELGIASFVDESKDPQSYVDRYNTETHYKEWFDKTYPEYDSIHQAVGLEAPKELAPFVDESKDPQSYVDRYNTEAVYKKWFDDNYPDITIYEAVGLEAPKELAPFVDPNLDPQHYIDRYNNEITYKEWFDKTYPDITIYEAVGLEEPEAEFGNCGEGTRLIDGVCTIFDEIEYGQCGEGTELVGNVCEIIGKTKVSEKPWWQFW